MHATSIVGLCRSIKEGDNCLIFRSGLIIVTKIQWNPLIIVIYTWACRQVIVFFCVFNICNRIKRHVGGKFIRESTFFMNVYNGPRNIRNLHTCIYNTHSHTHTCIHYHLLHTPLLFTSLLYSFTCNFPPLWTTVVPSSTSLNILLLWSMVAPVLGLLSPLSAPLHPRCSSWDCRRQCCLLVHLSQAALVMLRKLLWLNSFC